MTRVFIAGGGLAGCLVALALAKRRPEIDFLLVESDGRLGGNHVWSFFASDVAPDHRWLLADVPVTRWPDHEVHFPRRDRVIPLGYNSLVSSDLDAAVRKLVPLQRIRLGHRIEHLDVGEVTLAGGERIVADAVIDARGPGPTPGLVLAWQKFVGRKYRFARPHGRYRPVIMDATVDQNDGYRFVYSLPFTATELLIEDTYYSTSPALDDAAIGAELGMQLHNLAPGAAEPISEERGVLPVLLGGSVDALWADGPPVARLGLRGGFFHPTTGYSLPDAVRNAALLAEQSELTSAGLHDLFHRRARRLWKDRRYFQLLNRMLFHGAAPRERYRVLEHFYRLPAPLIGRFYAGELTLRDKLRILSGRPPVPVGRAVSAVLRRAA
jgi:lycopene beta-cyclase